MLLSISKSRMDSCAFDLPKLFQPPHDIRRSYLSRYCTNLVQRQISVLAPDHIGMGKLPIAPPHGHKVQYKKCASKRCSPLPKFNLYSHTCMPTARCNSSCALCPHQWFPSLHTITQPIGISSVFKSTSLSQPLPYKDFFFFKRIIHLFFLLFPRFYTSQPCIKGKFHRRTP